MAAKLDHESGSSLHLRLTDPAAGPSADVMASINAQLLREGLAVIDQLGCSYLATYRYTVDMLEEAVEEAKKERVGICAL
ncbi:hypothetical protein DENSPDRAFT_839349 [Dentipellis sp. KUC8613]|nr:hypothetical protein DENSPDRAFT_839349 [Dentipellis sp. KUC8613]